MTIQVTLQVSIVLPRNGESPFEFKALKMVPWKSGSLQELIQHWTEFFIDKSDHAMPEITREALVKAVSVVPIHSMDDSEPTNILSTSTSGITTTMNEIARIRSEISSISSEIDVLQDVGHDNRDSATIGSLSRTKARLQQLLTQLASRHLSES